MGKSKIAKAMEIRCGRYGELLEREPSDLEDKRGDEIMARFIHTDSKEVLFHDGIIKKAYDLMETYGSYTEDETQYFQEAIALVKCAALELAMYETDNKTTIEEGHLETMMMQSMDSLYQGMLVYWDQRIGLEEKYINTKNGGGRGL